MMNVEIVIIAKCSDRVLLCHFIFDKRELRKINKKKPPKA